MVDANILCRLARRDDPQNEIAQQAIDVCLEKGLEVVLLPQAEREFWVVATRPQSVNGLGLNPTEASEYLRAFEQFAVLRPETAAVHEHWKRIVVENQVSGKDAHDAGYVAAMRAHGLTQLVTFDVADFRRYTREITVMAPDQLFRELTLSRGLTGPPPEQPPKRDQRDRGLDR